MTENTAPTAALYTELPYPADGVVRTTIAEMLRRGLQTHAPSLLQREGELRLVDIGCGTGEATVGIAQQFPRMKIVGVDINPASLERAEALARKEKANVTFVQCNITNGVDEILRALPEGEDAKFDLISSMGVLHHLEEPPEGFAQARKLIKDDGLFLCYIYSKLGRWDDIAARSILDRAVPEGASFEQRAEALRLLNVSGKHSLRDSVKSLGKRLKHGPPLAPFELLKVYFARTGLTHVSDTFSNPCEHLYYFSELMDIFDASDWSFVALAEKGGLPTTPEQHTSDPKRAAWLRRLPPDVLYDYFAFIYRAWGFTFFLRPADCLDI